MHVKDCLIPSATTIILHQDGPSFKVLLLRRNAKIKFHGGSWVFPGGKIDWADCEKPKESTHSLPDYFQSLTLAEQLATAVVAAKRELKEEAGIELFDSDFRFCSQWITPASLPKRFDARFFLAEVTDDKVNIDHSEIVDYQWLTPKQALTKLERGEITLPPPTFVTLTYLSDFSHAQQAIDEMCRKPMTFRPKLVPVKNGFYSMYEEDSGYQAGDPEDNEFMHRLSVLDGKFTYFCNQNR